MPIYEEEDFDRMLDSDEMDRAKAATKARRDREKQQVDDWMRWVEESYNGQSQ